MNVSSVNLLFFFVVQISQKQQKLFFIMDIFSGLYNTVPAHQIKHQNNIKTVVIYFEKDSVHGSKH